MNKGFIFKFGPLADTISPRDWKTKPLEALEPKTDWVVILTDDAEAYRDKINAIVTKIKHPKTCFVIDLHLCANYKHLQKLWDNYVMTDRESVEVLLSFIHHHLVNHSMISFTIQDFRERSVPYPLVRAISTEIGKKCPIDLKAKAMCFGLCFEHDSDQATSYLNTFNEDIEEIDEDTFVSWSIQNSSDNVIEAIFLYEPQF